MVMGPLDIGTRPPDRLALAGPWPARILAARRGFWSGSSYDARMTPSERRSQRGSARGIAND